MKTIQVRKYFFWLFLLVSLSLSWLSVSRVSAQDETPTPQSEVPTPAQIMEAVNNLRLSRGLNPLNAHPVLMQIAQYQADGIATGMQGHWRPNGLTLGQWLISLGYPLSGDLTLDGYRSENWGFAQNADEAIAMWLSDDEHTNTMLSIYRSDMGVGIALSEEGYVIVMETALQTKSGQQQTEAYAILTGIPATQAAYSGMATQDAENGLLPQGMMPVAVSTADPQGNVYHEVKYGQTLWSIAITYGTTIKQIQQLNNLLDTILQPGQKLLVLNNATQTAPREASVIGTTAAPSPAVSTPTFVSTHTQTSEPVRMLTAQEKRQNTLGVVGIGIAALFLGGLFTAMTKRKPI
jgi:LysM repeat protein